jgi:hypothetical protein
MSDFDEVLERLLGDPAFKARLAADPQGALAGYHLNPDELDILRSQIGEAGGQTHVEQRTSKASMFGVFSAIGSGLDDVLHGHGHGFAGHTAGTGGAEAGRGMHDVVEQYGGRHSAPEPTGHGILGGHVQDVPQSGRHAVSGLEEVHTESHTEVHTEFHHHQESSGTVYRSSTYSGGGLPAEQPPPPAVGAQGVASGLTGYVGQAPTDGYHTRVDWDGDGRWDQHTYVNRADGGVDIVVDTDGDGRAEFIGHDTDRDGLINSSEIDTNHDGVMDARYEDVNGDGWLDRRTK